MLYLLQKISKGIYEDCYEVNRMVIDKLLTGINCRFVNIILDKHFKIS